MPNNRNAAPDTTERPGYTNRHTTPLPTEVSVIKILYIDSNGIEYAFTCVWQPFKASDYDTHNMPGEGYLGTAKAVPFYGLHAWAQNNSEFIYYKIID